MTRKCFFLLMLACLAGTGLAQAETSTESTRGELLYSTHCISCHNTRLHWRHNKAAKNWASLQAEVDRWQKASGLGWREEDVTDVARYLNARYYGFPAPDPDRSPTADAAQALPEHRDAWNR